MSDDSEVTIWRKEAGGEWHRVGSAHVPQPARVVLDDDDKVLNTPQMLVLATIVGAASWVGIFLAIKAMLSR